MDSDLALVTGLGLVILALPALLAAWVEDRPPRVGTVVLIGGAALVVWAATRHPGGYAPAEVPGVFYGVIARLL